ncbi:MAG: SUMF1/EgtB/PvdO family nonheme iron enzyme [Myxococcota bacterium]
MVVVPGGEFKMGSALSPNELPTREVWVDTFWLDRTEVTVGAYEACVDEGACTEPSTEPYCNWAKGEPVAGRAGHPVNCVDWTQAEEYCAWAGEGTKRLPTEAEWEKAARGTDARIYPWGDIPEPSCSHVVMSGAGTGSGCGMGSTGAVGSTPLGASPYGAQDMAGNVWEWVADWYGDYDEDETNNPMGPRNGTLRIMRGGSWLSYWYTNNFRAANRYSDNPAYSYSDVGFRCARTPPGAL